VSVSVEDFVVSVADLGDAEGIVEVIHTAFRSRPALDPPSTAVDETPESIRGHFARGGTAIYATVAGCPAGVILVSGASQKLARFSRVSVHPAFQRHGIASAMVIAAEDHAAELGFRRAELFAREELADLISFWHRLGYGPARSVPHGLMLAKTLPLAIEVPTADDMRRLGARLAGFLEPGDLVVASGELGAGKTTLTQGIGQGLDSAGQIISPTFVLSRVHVSTSGKPDLLHVDAYRLSNAAELDDLDLDTHLADAITVVEWGTGLAEGLTEDRLEIDIRASADGVPGLSADGRLVLIRPVGRRWRHVDLDALARRSPELGDGRSATGQTLRRIADERQS
jgi:tRNA threonylcarbamoyladenosine biosynthesis protein TsaE